MRAWEQRRVGLRLVLVGVGEEKHFPVLPSSRGEFPGGVGVLVFCVPSSMQCWKMWK